MTKPVNTYNPAKTTTRPPMEVKKLDNVGGLIFSPAVNQDCVKVENKNGKRYYSVTLPEDVKIEYYEQKKDAKISYYGDEFYGMHTDGTNLEGVAIKGSPKANDTIRLFGKSKNNTLIVNNENIFNIGTSDQVFLDKDTKNNKVHLGLNDGLDIDTYADLTKLHEQEAKEAKKHNEYEPIFVKSQLQVRGRGVSEQEAQLQSSLTVKQYSEHKTKQAK